MKTTMTTFQNHPAWYELVLDDSRLEALLSDGQGRASSDKTIDLLNRLLYNYHLLPETSFAMRPKLMVICLNLAAKLKWNLEALIEHIQPCLVEVLLKCFIAEERSFMGEDDSMKTTPASAQLFSVVVWNLWIVVCGFKFLSPVAKSLHSKPGMSISIATCGFVPGLQAQVLPLTNANDTILTMISVEFSNSQLFLQSVLQAITPSTPSLRCLARIPLSFPLVSLETSFTPLVDESSQKSIVSNLRKLSIVCDYSSSPCAIPNWLASKMSDDDADSARCEWLNLGIDEEYQRIRTIFTASTKRNTAVAVFVTEIKKLIKVKNWEKIISLARNEVLRTIRSEEPHFMTPQLILNLQNAISPNLKAKLTTLYEFLSVALDQPIQFSANLDAFIGQSRQFDDLSPDTRALVEAWISRQHLLASVATTPPAPDESSLSTLSIPWLPLRENLIFTCRPPEELLSQVTYMSELLSLLPVNWRLSTSLTNQPSSPLMYFYLVKVKMLTKRGKFDEAKRLLDQFKIKFKQSGVPPFLLNRSLTSPSSSPFLIENLKRESDLLNVSIEDLTTVLTNLLKNNNFSVLSNCSLNLAVFQFCQVLAALSLRNDNFDSKTAQSVVWKLICNIPQLPLSPSTNKSVALSIEDSTFNAAVILSLAFKLIDHPSFCPIFLSIFSRLIIFSQKFDLIIDLHNPTPDLKWSKISPSNPATLDYLGNFGLDCVKKIHCSLNGDLVCEAMVLRCKLDTFLALQYYPLAIKTFLRLAFVTTQGFTLPSALNSEWDRAVCVSNAVRAFTALQCYHVVAILSQFSDSEGIDGYGDITLASYALKNACGGEDADTVTTADSAFRDADFDSILTFFCEPALVEIFIVVLENNHFFEKSRILNSKCFSFPAQPTDLSNKTNKMAYKCQVFNDFLKFLFHFYIVDEADLCI